ncbi:MAG: AbrB/MazE/SpoVT family DNA-binding domain-containing protein [Pseudoxanthomonas sp.]
MQINVGKWGNSMAIRLPAETVRAARLREGEPVEVSVTPAGEIHIVPLHAFDKAAFLAKAGKIRQSMPMTEPVVRKLRDDARY